MASCLKSDERGMETQLLFTRSRATEIRSVARCLQIEMAKPCVRDLCDPVRGTYISFISRKDHTREEFEISSAPLCLCWDFVK